MSNIPKRIHYCWFGKNEMSPVLKRCLNSWQTILPNYEIIRWDESNFDINSNSYTKEAYEAGKWAFVSDYARLMILYQHGGIYLDTDVEVLKSFDVFLEQPAFCGFEQDNNVGSAVIGSSKQNLWIETLLHYYDNKHFKRLDGSLDQTPNIVFISKLSKENFNCRLDNSLQHLEHISLYPKDYFCCNTFFVQEKEVTENSVCIHHFDGSWEDRDSFRFKVYDWIKETFGDKTAIKLYKAQRKLRGK